MRHIQKLQAIAMAKKQLKAEGKANAKTYPKAEGKANAKTYPKAEVKTHLKADDCSWQFDVLARKLHIHLKAEHRFHPTRRWRFDYAFVQFKVAIEINGGVWIQGRHNRGKGYLGDMEKLNAAQTLGWVVLQFPPDNIDFPLIEKTITQRWPMQFGEVTK